MIEEFVGGIGRIALPCYPQHNTFGRVKCDLPFLLPLLKMIKVLLQADAILA